MFQKERNAFLCKFEKLLSRKNPHFSTSPIYVYSTFYVLCSRHKNTVKCASNEIRCMYVCGDENSWARVTQESHEYWSPASIDDYTVSFTQHRCIRPLGLWFNTSRRKSKRLLKWFDSCSQRPVFCLMRS